MTHDLKNKIAIALSGGVDSAVAGALLLEDGWDVIGVTLQLQDVSHPSCGSFEALEQSRVVAQQLGIRHFVVDCVEDFERLVLRPSLDGYASGRTPNPCLWCNERIKFGILLDYALKSGCDALATGHYVKIDNDGLYVKLLRGDDRNKDQTYFLAGLTQEQLSRLVFPLGGKHKDWVRKKANELGLRCAERKESQDVCFMLPGQSFAESLQMRFEDSGATKKGFIVDWKGIRLASHEGIHNFTIGQRRGVKVGTGVKAWVCRLDAATGDVYLTNNENDLLCSEITVSDLCWTSTLPPKMPLECEVQIRYRSQPTAATLFELPRECGKIVFQTPVRAVTPGQAAVFYRENCVLGRGWLNSPVV